MYFSSEATCNTVSGSFCLRSLPLFNWSTPQPFNREDLVMLSSALAFAIPRIMHADPTKVFALVGGAPI
eukprot:6482656-Amphidinium_carterae.1